MEYFENLYQINWKNLKDMNKFLDAFKQPKLDQQVIKHINGSITSNGIEAVIKSLPTKKSTGPAASG
jgi:hypothetical protein